MVGWVHEYYIFNIIFRVESSVVSCLKLRSIDAFLNDIRNQTGLSINEDMYQLVLVNTLCCIRHVGIYRSDNIVLDIRPTV